MKQPMRILFVTRKYPPSTGGMETAAYELYTALSVTNDVTLIAWGGSNRALPVAYPWLLARAVWHGLRNRPDVIYLQDGVMAPLGWFLKITFRRPTILTIHGREATYGNPLYQLLVTPFIRRQTKLVAVSTETKHNMEQALPQSKPAVIFNGVRDSFYSTKARVEVLQVIAAETGVPLKTLEHSKLLHTNGRLVRRKGVLWFVDNVMPKLEDNVKYLVSGTGKDRDRIEASIVRNELQGKVYILGRVSDELLRALYNAADIFVMPNVPVANDMEGFGLVALEAASCGTMVVASKQEGIKDAIIDGKNGLLVEPKDVGSYVKIITGELTKPTLQSEDIRNYTLSHYGWQDTAMQYEQLMHSLVG